MSDSSHRSLSSLVIFGVAAIWFMSKLKTKPQKPTISITPKQDTRNKSDSSQILSSLISEIPPSPTNAENSCKRCQQKIPRWKEALEIGTFIAALSAAIATGVYAFITHRMWCEMQQQTQLLQKQTEASLEAILQKQFMIAGRQDKPYLRIVLTNRGRVIASSVQADFQLTLVSISNQGQIVETRTLRDWKFTVSEVTPSIDSVSERGIFLNVPNELASRSKIERAIKLTGVVSYFNGFRQRPEPVCYYIINALQFKNKGGSSQGSRAAAILCDALPSQIAWLEENKALN